MFLCECKTYEGKIYVNKYGGLLHRIGSPPPLGPATRQHVYLLFYYKTYNDAKGKTNLKSYYIQAVTFSHRVSKFVCKTFPRATGI